MLRNYQIIDKIYESDNSIVYKAIAKADKSSVILKILKQDFPTLEEVNRYKQEYKITRSFNSEAIIKAYDFERYDSSYVIILEDFGGISLQQLITNESLEIGEFLNIAIKITDSLLTIHKHNVIHKDINPSNIVYNPQTQTLKVIDFGISSNLSQEFLAFCPPNQLEGTLTYIAPEQTGRMNRGIDYRSDFYSLGATFYELLTHQIPFVTNDPMRLVHCHLAQKPRSAYLINSKIPITVSKIIDKLLAKNPEQRYQSAIGIKADLINCYKQLQTTGSIVNFTIGREDVVDKLQIPQKLYGRENEIGQLIDAFDHISRGNIAMVTVAGYSGIGKSALISEIYKPITQRQGQFINGKFDQLQKGIPYSAISQALQSLIRQILSESPDTLQRWKQKILETLRDNGQIIIDVIPELEKIIGKQPPVEQIGTKESQKRFNLFFNRFVNIFCSKEHPLVIFIDDLQWADLPSLKLIEKLMLDNEHKYLLFIGAYRDNEVTPTHPLTNSLDKINQTVPIENITLRALSIKHINQLISETLSCELKQSKPLAGLINSKTEGNPFFITQLLFSLFEKNLLRRQDSQPDSEAKSQSFWQWNISDIEKEIAITDNVVELMVKKISKLEPQTRNVLKLAACIGNSFDLQTLAVVNKKSSIETAYQLQSALDEGLITPLDNSYKVPLLEGLEDIGDNETLSEITKKEYIPYKFLHDKVQQASYSLIAEDDKKQLHLDIGYILLRNNDRIQDKKEETIFKIVEHLNLGISLIRKQTQKDELAQLNLKAGKKAKNVAAYSVALKFIELAKQLLTKKHWQRQYEFTYEIYLENLELLFFNSQLKKAQNLLPIIADKANNSLDRVKVYQIEILIHNAKSDEHQAILVAQKALQELGIDIALEYEQIVTRIEQEKQQIEIFLQNNSWQDLKQLPQSQDPNYIQSLLILQQIMSSTIISNFLLHIEAVLIPFNLCLKNGNSDLASTPYLFYASFLCIGLEYINLKRNITLANDLGKVAIYLQEKANNPQLEPIVAHMYYGFIWHWQNFIRNSSSHEKLVNGFQKGIESGNYEFACFSCVSYCLLKFFGGYPLDPLYKDTHKYLQKMKQLQQIHSVTSFEGVDKIIYRLITDNKLSKTLLFAKTKKQEQEYLQDFTENHWMLFFVYFSKMFNAYVFNHPKLTLEYFHELKQHVDYLSSHILNPQYYFYTCLVICYSIRSQKITKKQKELIDILNKNQENLLYIIKHCPENFQNKYDFIEAEKARILGEVLLAQEYYEKAIRGARESGFIHEEAFACERAFEFYLSIGQEQIAQFYIRNAYQCYSQWGAIAKVKQLENKYSQYLVNTNQSNQNSLSERLTSSVSTTGSSNGEILDLSSVIKATQAISGEIKLERLLENLIQITIENAGAQKGYLILPDRENNLVIEAQGIAEENQDNDIKVLESISIDSISDNFLPVVPTKIINYVARTSEVVVLENAMNNNRFSQDDYVIGYQSKSILCLPLINKAELKGIVYLENNLAEGVFTDERIELLKILSAQATISIENSRLYANLEQLVEQRTNELTKTLDVLKATQAELIFENQLLKEPDEQSEINYQVGGSLGLDASSYVVRSADRLLYKALQKGEFCYILNARQMGKSSLMVRMMNHLTHEGYKCVSLDLTVIGSENITIEQWYKGFATALLRSLKLHRQIKIRTWWEEHLDLSPIQRISELIEEILQIQTDETTEKLTKIVIFIDELDCILSLPFSLNDFFAFIRSCYNQRSLSSDSIYHNLTFAFFGVAAPQELMTDKKSTPFNIGTGIKLESFKINEAQPLLAGIREKINHPQTLLEEILHWTGGQPFLTQKLFRFIYESDMEIPINGEADWLGNLVQEKIITNWQAQDQPQHLKTISDRILFSANTKKLLTMYRRVLEQGSIIDPNNDISKELILTGIVIENNGQLVVHNRIYQDVFNLEWITTTINSSK